MPDSRVHTPDPSSKRFILLRPSEHRRPVKPKKRKWHAIARNLILLLGLTAAGLVYRDEIVDTMRHVWTGQ